MSQNLHSVYLLHRDPFLRKMQELATYVRIDGIPIIYFGRLRRLPLRVEHRTGWMDWIEPFMAEAEGQGWRLFYLGSKPGVAEKGADVLKTRYPQLQIATHHGYFDPTKGSPENGRVVEKVNAYAPDVLIVGMGMPRQERWILENGEGLKAPVILTSGACMDYVAGVQSTPPRWLGPIGMEWLYRLASNPRRMWRRYLVEPWFALGLFLKEATHPPDESG